MRSLNVKVLLGAVLYRAELVNYRIQEISLATRYGTVKILANGYVDASGDAALGFFAGLQCKTAENMKVWGTQMMVLKGVDYSQAPPASSEINKRAEETATRYNLRRTTSVVFYLPNRGDLFYGNMTHVDTPLNPFEDSLISITGKDEVDRVLEFLKAEFPKTFGKASIHHYVNTGIRQTRCISALHQLTIQDLVSGKRFSDAVGRTAWPVELHNSEESYIWNTFDKNHVHYIPFSCMLSPEADNYVAAGRCIDADASALSSVRVMGPCSAMGTAAAHALMLSGNGSVYEINIDELKNRLRRNLEDE